MPGVVAPASARLAAAASARMVVVIRDDPSSILDGRMSLSTRNTKAATAGKRTRLTGKDQDRGGGGRGRNCQSGGFCGSVTSGGKCAHVRMVGNATIMPINLQHLTPQESGHLAIVSQHECSLEVFLPWQSVMAALDGACAAASAEPTGASPTASAIRAARRIRYITARILAA